MSDSISSNLPLWILLFPLGGFLLNATLYPLITPGLSKTTNIGAGLIAVSVMIASFVAAFIGFCSLADGSAALQTEGFRWVDLADFSVAFNLRLDRLSSIMALIITGVGSLIHIYSIGYMAHEKAAARFFAYLNLFCFAMLLLVLSDNLLLLFFGWEGVGLCSYLLIGYWYEKTANADAARKAFIVNRVGDLGLVLALCLLYANFGTLSFSELMARVSPAHAGVLASVAALLFFAATGKSAQFPLYVWLPDAMAGPTPVSALIHAATMVTAGVYLLARLHFVFELVPYLMTIVAWTGVLTVILGGTIALVQHDIKKVLAYSTVSQLGFMFIACGVGAYHAAVFHLLTHAFFKALLFLGAGSVIHACDGEQDLRRMGGLAKALPLTFWTMLVGSGAIVGLPLLSGFFSKDAILYFALNMPRGGTLIFAASLLGAALTALYTIRLIQLCFWGKSRAGIQAHESPLIMTLPLLVLAVLAGFAGFLGMPHGLGDLLGIKVEAFGEWLTPVVPATILEPSQIILAEHWVSVIAVAISILALCLGYILVLRQKSLAFAPFRQIFEAKYGLDEFYQKAVVGPLFKLGRGVALTIEDGLVRNIGSWLGSGSVWSSGRLRLLQNGDLQSLALYMSAGLGLALAISFFWTHL